MICANNWSLVVFQGRPFFLRLLYPILCEKLTNLKENQIVNLRSVEVGLEEQSAPQIYLTRKIQKP